MRVLLDQLLPEIVGVEWAVRVIQHEGKSDLEGSISRKMRAWRNPHAKFLILRDNDGADCKALKARLINLVPLHQREIAVVRIVCQELEAWYLGDMHAVEKSGLATVRGLVRMSKKERFRNPDATVNPKIELKKIAAGYQPISGARTIGPHMRVDENRSASFNHVVAAVRRMTKD